MVSRRRWVTVEETDGGINKKRRVKEDGVNTIQCPKPAARY